MSGELGTFCIYEGESPEAIREHAIASGMAADEIVPVLDTVVAPRPGRGDGVIRRAFTAGLLAVAALAAPAQAAPSDLAAARAATAGFHHGHPGYSLLTDAAGIACIDKAGEGGMGVHYVNGALVADRKVSASAPELVVYEPLANGGQRLVAAEYVVFQSDWDAKHDEAPELFGRESSSYRPATATACRRSTSSTPGCGSTTRPGCSRTSTRASPARTPESSPSLDQPSAAG